MVEEQAIHRPNPLPFASLITKLVSDIKDLSIKNTNLVIRNVPVRSRRLRDRINPTHSTHSRPFPLI